jgi:hypothetical protein
MDSPVSLFAGIAPLIREMRRRELAQREADIKAARAARDAKKLH